MPKHGNTYIHVHIFYKTHIKWSNDAIFELETQYGGQATLQREPPL